MKCFICGLITRGSQAHRSCFKMDLYCNESMPDSPDTPMQEVSEKPKEYTENNPLAELFLEEEDYYRAMAEEIEAENERIDGEGSKRKFEDEEQEYMYHQENRIVKIPRGDFSEKYHILANRLANKNNDVILHRYISSLTRSDIAYLMADIWNDIFYQTKINMITPVMVNEDLDFVIHNDCVTGFGADNYEKIHEAYLELNWKSDFQALTTMVTDTDRDLFFCIHCDYFIFPCLMNYSAASIKKHKLDYKDYWLKESNNNGTDNSFKIFMNNTTVFSDFIGSSTSADE